MYTALYLIGIICAAAIPVLVVITALRIMNRKPVVYFIHGMAFLVMFAVFAFILGYMLENFKG